MSREIDPRDCENGWADTEDKYRVPANLKDEYMEMVDDCENRESQMNEWECEFIESISNRLAEDSPLSEKQIEKLNAIWEKATAKG